MRIPRIIIAGTNSGCGKTTITTGIMSALKKRGRNVQPFKVGPDYIDPMFHSYILGRKSRNLDSWMLDSKTISYLFSKNSMGNDIAVVEGVMGVFDGFGGYSQTGSTADVAKIIKAPVILVINAEGMSLSAAALIKGFCDFDSELCIKGIIINNIKSVSHYKMLKDSIEEHTGVLVLGFLKKTDELKLPSRHLGLIPSEEITELDEMIERLTLQIEETVDLELLIKIAEESENLNEYSFSPNWDMPTNKIKIGIAKDKAFNFYYQDNLDLLNLLGAKLIEFSPLKDKKLPQDINGLYLGGGYPEIFAGELSNNRLIMQDIKNKFNANMPVYAECGGMMYLCNTIRTLENKEYNMVGVIPAESKMTSSLKRFGYVEIESMNDNIISKVGDKIRAHEFHYSVTIPERNVQYAYQVTKTRKKSSSSWHCGYKSSNMIAGYPHIHFWSNIDFAKNFVSSCKMYK